MTLPAELVKLCTHIEVTCAEYTLDSGTTWLPGNLIAVFGADGNSIPAIAASGYPAPTDPLGIGEPFVRSYYTDASLQALNPQPTAGDVRPCGTPAVARFIVERYRLAYDVPGTALAEIPTNNANVPASPYPVIGDTVTILPGWSSYAWYWEPQTYPISDGAGGLLLPEVWEDGRVYVAPWTGTAIFPQIQVIGESVDAPGGVAAHQVTLTAYSGAFIELRVTRPV